MLVDGGFWLFLNPALIFRILISFYTLEALIFVTAAHFHPRLDWNVRDIHLITKFAFDVTDP